METVFLKETDVVEFDGQIVIVRLSNRIFKLANFSLRTCPLVECNNIVNLLVLDPIEDGSKVRSVSGGVEWLELEVDESVNVGKDPLLGKLLGHFVPSCDVGTAMLLGCALLLLSEVN